MLLGPIFRVELVSIARRRRYFVLRTVYALLILFVLWTTYSSSRYLAYNTGGHSIRYSAALAASFFIGYSWLQILAILLIGPAMAAGTIATERERRTIEYLFATDLSNGEIILGKTFARLTLMGQYVLAGLPILFLFRLLGGIPATALVAIFLSAGGTATMLTGLSIAVSVWSPKARDAIGRVYLLLIALFSLPLILYGLRGIDVFSDAAWQAIGEPLVNGISLLNPLSTLSHAMGSASAVGIGLDITRIYHAVGSQLLLALISLAIAMFAVRRVHLGETTKSAVQKARLTLLSFRRPPGERPMIWKEMFSPSSSTSLGRIGWVALGVILLGTLVFTIWFFVESFASYARRRENYFEFQFAVTGYLGCGMLLLLAARSAGLISQEKERDCWISLLSTPLTGEEIIVGKLCGNLYSARWMLLVLVVSWGLGLLIDPNSVLPVVLMCSMFLGFATFVSCLGLLFSLRSPTTLRAMGQTLGTLIFCGGGYFFCCCPIMVGGGGREWEFILAPCIPFLLTYPGLAFLSQSSGNTNYFFEGGMPLAYVIGVLGYLIATVSLYVFMVNEFDRLAGRTNMTPDLHTPIGSGVQSTNASQVDS